MNIKLPITLFSMLACFIPQASAHDIAEGSILAVDRKARTIVFTDRSVWSLDNLKTALPTDLKAGDRVRISYEASEDGVGSIAEIKLLPTNMAKAETTTAGASDADISTGTVFVYDRKANLIVLTDRTIWSLDVMNSAAPSGLRAGVRVRIRYQSDEDGVSAINSIEIL